MKHLLLTCTLAFGFNSVAIAEDQAICTYSPASNTSKKQKFPPYTPDPNLAYGVEEQGDFDGIRYQLLFGRHAIFLVAVKPNDPEENELASTQGNYGDKSIRLRYRKNIVTCTLPDDDE